MADNNSKWSGQNPWLGLGAYTEGQRLYGRDEETAALVHIVQNSTAMVVYGKSGIGKSSLLRAGVFPLLRSHGCVPVYLRLAHNTPVAYTEQIEQAVAQHVRLRDQLPASVPDLGLWDYLHRHQFVDDQGQAVTPVIVLDQFEEIFTLTDVAHKAQVQQLFTELADVLNDVKPAQVLEVERNSTVQPQAQTQAAGGFTLQPLARSAMNYLSAPSFRIIISLRDDSLYLLERLSARIPALKANRYNLQALSEQSALNVITQPRPGLFTEAEASDILDQLAYYEYDDYRVVSPAIISLFLYSYYKEQGNTSAHHIFEHYYQECVQSVSASSLSYIETHLLTEGGHRTQLPADALAEGGVSASELQHLLGSMILKKEKRGTTDYYEFSHDLLCKEAVKHKNKRQAERRIRWLVGGFAAILVLIGLGVWYFWPEPAPESARLVELQLQFAPQQQFEDGESWSAKFRLLALDKDSVLQLPVQTADGMPVDVLEIGSNSPAAYSVVVTKGFLDRQQQLRLQIYDTSDNCRGRTDTVGLAQWAAGPLVVPVERVQKIVFTGLVVTTEHEPIGQAMVALGQLPLAYTDDSGQFTFLLDDSTALRDADLYIFRQNYETEHFFCRFFYDSGRGSFEQPLVIPMRATGENDDSLSVEEQFDRQLRGYNKMYELALGSRRNRQELLPEDSLRLYAAMEACPDFARNLTKTRRTNKRTADGTLSIQCVSIENTQTDGIRTAIGNYLKDRKDYVYEGKMIRLGRAADNRWRLSAIAHDREGRRYVLQGVFDRITAGDDKTFFLEELRPYEQQP